MESEQDNDELFFAVRGNYRLSRISDLGLSLTRQEADYEPGSLFSSFDSDTLRITYSRQMAKNWDIQVQLADTDRSGDTPLSGFDETRIEFGLNYRFE